MKYGPSHLLRLGAALALGVAFGSMPAVAVSPAAEGDEATTSAGMILIDGELRTHRVTDVILDARGLRFRDETIHDAPSETRLRRVETCIALAQRIFAKAPPQRGLLLISDGQRLPGTLDLDAPTGTGNVAWKHPWLDSVSVPLERVSAVLLRPAATRPQPARSDVVELINGDRLEGFVTSIADPIVIEIEIAGAQQEVRIPLERAAAVALVTPRQTPEGRRVWLTDGTVLDLEHLAIGEDGYVRMQTAWVEARPEPPQVRLDSVTAVLFDPRRMIPLTNLSPSAIEGPPTRYVVPAPRALDPDVPLGLGRLEYRGPLLVRYILPRGAARFAAEASLADSARDWGDLVLVIRDDDEEIYRRHLSGENPADSINVAIKGSELTIELLPGAYGPVQDRLVLERAMLLIER